MHVRTVAAVNQSGRTPAFKNKKFMKAIKEIRKEVEQLKNQLFSKGIHQFTIDWVEKYEEELMEQESGEALVNDETLLGSMAYRIDNLIEIAKTDTEDYLIYQQLQAIIAEGRK